MTNLKRILLGGFLLLLVLVILAFVLENQQTVSLLFLGWEAPHLPASVVILAALLVGMIIGPLLRLLLGRALRARRKPSI
ncbi:LapA family protein [Pseudomonas sp. CH235]|uniref:LapA family protein n=1 Tax=Pseudomonas sp. CH235 TaxID=1634006 RepID=UPI001063F9E8|nr:LapA family protein [Pseudomonas sp. CH235]TEA62421.1 LapA family protein [Pseudomonas sp. CH235]